MVYRRTHTRDLDALSTMNLGRALPFAAFSFVVASAASMGIPGFSGFAAEITILIGTWRAYPLAVWIIGVGMVLVAAFTLRALKNTFFGEVRLQQGRVTTDPDWNEQENVRMRKGGSAAPWDDAKKFAAPPPFVTSSAECSIRRPEIPDKITLAEKFGACLLMFATLAVGLYPKLLLDRIIPCVESMRFLSPGG
jgi:NADH-quinone oxidoreductase subunit M